MNKSRLYQLLNFIYILFNKHHEIQKELKSREGYKIVKVIKKRENILILVNIVGTGKEIEFTPQEIVLNDTLLENFSKKDIRTISYLACENIKKPTLKILSLNFSEKIKKMLFFLKSSNDDNILEKTATEISIDNSIVSQLNSKDALRVGYVLGSENIIKENELKHEINSQQQVVN